MKRLHHFRTILIAALIIVLGYGGLVLHAYLTRPTTPTRTIVSQPQGLPLTRENLLSLVNRERAKYGVAPLVLDERLNWSAQQKADDMAKYNYFAHISDVSPNDRGDSRQWLQESGVQCANSSENIHDGTMYYATASGSVDGWIGSKPHHDAMISAKYTLTGFGYAVGNGLTYVVEHFCQQ